MPTRTRILTEEEKFELADIEYVRRLITKVYPDGVVSIVADSFDYWGTITKTAKRLKDVILARNGKVVFRPDTGDPVRIICGYKYKSVVKLEDLPRQGEVEYILYGGKVLQFSHYEDFGEPVWVETTQITTHEVKGSVECLWEIFGGTETIRGYKLLDAHVGLIYGDSITLDRAHAICEYLKQKGFASTNVVFGIGSYTYQYVTRDTDGYAVKATWCQVDGVAVEIYKKPKTDDGTKNSAYGLVAVYQDGKEFALKDHATWDAVRNCAFVPIFKDGKLLKDYSLSEIRATLASYL
jgi:nicotinamide phosphoribosyltransferase